MLGNFNVIPFQLQHDVPCFGYLISHPDSGVTAFITDSSSCDHIFPELSHVIIECNYARDILEANILAGKVRYTQGRRIIATHMELENCKKVLQGTDLSSVRNILLAHLSPDNSDEERFLQEIAAVTGKQVTIASAQVELDFGAHPCL